MDQDEQDEQDDLQDEQNVYFRQLVYYNRLILRRFVMITLFDCLGVAVILYFFVHVLYDVWKLGTFYLKSEAWSGFMFSRILSYMIGDDEIVALPFDTVRTGNYYDEVHKPAVVGVRGLVLGSLGVILMAVVNSLLFGASAAVALITWQVSVPVLGLIGFFLWKKQRGERK